MLSTNDLAWSPEMGGKEGLSALGYSRKEPMRGNLPERWVRQSSQICLLGDMAVKFETDGFEDFAEYMTVAEMQSCITRCRELEEGDR